jgi:hypothetical protein
MLARVLNLTAMPDSFAAGTTLKYTRSLTDYAANAGWSFTLAFNGGGIALAKAATASGTDFVLTMLPSETAVLVGPVTYRWDERVHNGVDVYVVGAGSVYVTPNVVLAGDLQSMDEKLLAAIDAVLVGKITDDVLQYTVEGRGLTLMSRSELYDLRQKVARNVARARAMGKSGRRRRVTFTGTRSER